MHWFLPTATDSNDAFAVSTLAATSVSADFSASEQAPTVALANLNNSVYSWIQQINNVHKRFNKHISINS